jgi:hypothetical protein
MSLPLVLSECGIKFINYEVMTKKIASIIDLIQINDEELYVKCVSLVT